jgi:hypothetical protein
MHIFLLAIEIIYCYVFSGGKICNSYFDGLFFYLNYNHAVIRKNIINQSA